MPPFPCVVSREAFIFCFRLSQVDEHVPKFVAKESRCFFRQMVEIREENKENLRSRSYAISSVCDHRPQVLPDQMVVHCLNQGVSGASRASEVSFHSVTARIFFVLSEESFCCFKR